MRRLTSAFVITCTAAVLVACGDAGDHFGEFRTNPNNYQAVVTSLAISMPIVASQQTKSGSFKLYVTGYDGSGNAIPVGKQLQNPIVITTNDAAAVKFGTGGSSVTFGSEPGTITVNYKAPPHPCNPVIGVTAFDRDANPQNVVQDVVACSASPTPTPTGGPTPTPHPTKSPKPTPSPSPTPTATPTPAAKRLVLSMPSTPNPLSPGTFTLVIKTYGPGGVLLPTGTALPNPIQLTSNSSCSISFLSASGSGTSLTVPTVPGSVNIAYSPPSNTCIPPNAIVISAFDLDATPQTAQFSILGGTATVGSITLTMISAPNITSQGVYPFFVTANDTSGNPIPFGETLSNPIELSSNASCATGFGTTLDPNTFTGTFRLTSTQTQVYIGFDPSPTCVPPTGGNVIVTGIAAGVSSATYTFPY